MLMLSEPSSHRHLFTHTWPYHVTTRTSDWLWLYSPLHSEPSPLTCLSRGPLLEKLLDSRTGSSVANSVFSYAFSGSWLKSWNFLCWKKIPPFRSYIFFSYPVLNGFIKNTLQLPASYFCTLQNLRTKFSLVTESQGNKHRGCFLERWAATKFRSQKVLSCSLTSKLEFILQYIALRVKPEMQMHPYTFREQNGVASHASAISTPGSPGPGTSVQSREGSQCILGWMPVWVDTAC